MVMRADESDQADLALPEVHFSMRMVVHEFHVKCHRSYLPVTAVFHFYSLPSCFFFFFFSF